MDRQEPAGRVNAAGNARGRCAIEIVDHVPTIKLRS
jgi:hypothetical protein